MRGGSRKEERGNRYQLVRKGFTNPQQRKKFREDRRKQRREKGGSKKILEGEDDGQGPQGGFPLEKFFKERDRARRGRTKSNTWMLRFHSAKTITHGGEK